MKKAPTGNNKRGEREGKRGREREREGEREKKRLGKFGFLAVFRTCLHFQGPFKRGRE